MADEVNNRDDIKEMMLKEIIQYGKFSFQLEQEREQSLLQQAGQMMTAFSIITAVLYLLLPILLQYTISSAHKFIWAVLALVTIFLLTSFVLSLLAQWRYKYQTFRNINEFYNHVNLNYKDFMSSNGFCRQWINSLDNVQKSVKEKNDKRVNLVKASQYIFLIALFVFTISTFIGLILYI